MPKAGKAPQAHYGSGDYAGIAAGRERTGKGSIFAEDGACPDAKKTASARSSFLPGT